MDAVNSYLANSVDSYFSALTKLGYISYGEVNKLLAALFIAELLEATQEVITEEDYRSIGEAWACLFGSNCLLPYPEFKKNPTEIIKYNPFL